MVRNRRLARTVSDAGFGEFIRQLQYKTAWYGSKLWAADRWYPSSKTCSACGAINAGLTLSHRTAPHLDLYVRRRTRPGPQRGPEPLDRDARRYLTARRYLIARCRLAVPWET